tara:strand:+ start:824 stop:1054 length:231 start_codon:yes stop_codon:yes gene_type:complete
MMIGFCTLLAGIWSGCRLPDQGFKNVSRCYIIEKLDDLEASRRVGKPCEPMIVGIPYHTIEFERVETVERTAVLAS